MTAVGLKPDRHTILWDRDCGFCRRSVAWFIRRDTQQALQAVPYQEAPSPPMTPDLATACDRAVHVVRVDGAVLRAGRAALFILEVIGWKWTARILRVPPLIWGVEVVYWVIARNRRFFSRFLFRQGGQSCELPAREEPTPNDTSAP